MRILLLESDPQYRNAIRGALEPRGFEIIPTANVEQVFAQHRIRPADVLIVSVEPNAGSAAELTRRVEADTNRPPLGLLVLSSFYRSEDTEIKALQAQFTASDLLSRPFGALDLLERVEGVVRRVRSSGAARGGPSRAEAPPVATDLRASPGDPRVLSLLARLWASRASGVLTIEQGGVERLVRMAQGGIVDQDGKALVFAALRGGAEVRFEPGDVGDRGDPAALGDLLWRVARDPRQTRFGNEHRFEALSRTPWTNAALTLPIGDGTRRLLSAADGQATLGELIARGAMDAESVSVDIHALRQLRLVVLQAPVTRARRVVEPRLDVSAPPAPPPAAQGAENETIALNVWHDPSTQPGAIRPSSQERAVAPREAAGRPGGAPGGGISASVLPIGGLKARASDARASGENVDTHTSLSERRRAAIALSLRSALGHSQTNAPTATGTASTLTRNRASIAHVITRLEREMGVVRTAAPAVVLGLPADAPPEQVRIAAERHRQRYLAVENNEQLPPDARELARDIRRRVEEAERDWGRQAATGALAVGAADADRLLEMGRAQIGRQDWQGAELTLSRARAQRADHPGVLAFLGWARFNNIRYGLSERTKEARELLLLAEQFDPHHGEAQYYLAELLYRLGEYDAALPRASRAMKAQPESAPVALLYRKLRARLTG